MITLVCFALGAIVALLAVWLDKARVLFEKERQSRPATIALQFEMAAAISAVALFGAGLANI